MKGFPELLTLIFIILKVLGVVSWSWWIVFLPIIAGWTISILLFIIVFSIAWFSKDS